MMVTVTVIVVYGVVFFITNFQDLATVVVIVIFVVVIIIAIIIIIIIIIVTTTVSVALTPFNGHIKNAKQRTIIQQ